MSSDPSPEINPKRKKKQQQQNMENANISFPLLQQTRQNDIFLSTLQSRTD